jgi:hypothetical protein
MKLEVISPATWIQKKEREMANLPIRSSRGVDVSANRKSGQTRWRVLLLICSALLFPLERATGEITFLNSWGSTGDKDGEFDNPNGITIGPSGNIYVTDSLNHRIQIFDNDVDDTFLSKFGTTGSGDGNFVSPFNLALTPTDDLYVIDLETSRV